MITYTAPERVNIDTGKLSTWGSVRQPYLVTMYRRDGQYSGTVTQNGYHIIFGTNPAFLDRPVNVGEVFTVVDNFTGLKVTGKVTAVISNPQPAGNALLVTDIPAGTLSGAGYINWARNENYVFQLQLFGNLANNQNGVYLGIAEGTPDAYGKAVIDISDLLLREMRKQNYFDYAQLSPSINKRDIVGWLSFNLFYADRYIFDGRPQSSVTGWPKLLNSNGENLYWGIDGVKYLMDQYGQNYADYLPDAVIHPAKFLTAFEVPTYFEGYPFSLSFIYNIELNGQPVALQEDELAGTGPAVTNQTTTGLDNSQAGGVNQVTMAGVYAATTNYINAYLEITGAAVPQRFAAPGYVATGYGAAPSAPAVPGGTVITELQTIAINRDCRIEPIYLMWRNQLGGWDYWLFDKLAETEVTAVQGMVFQNYVDYIDTHNYREQITGATQVRKVTLGDSVDKQTIKALSGIEGAPQVFMLVNNDFNVNTPALNWMGVRMALKGFKYTNRGNLFDVEVTILMPETYMVGN